MKPKGISTLASSALPFLTLVHPLAVVPVDDAPWNKVPVPDVLPRVTYEMVVLNAGLPREPLTLVTAFAPIENAISLLPVGVRVIV